jgi:DNA primase
MSSFATRVDTDLLLQQHPIVDVIAQYGIELRRSGSAFTGRCPFHPDHGRANLTAYPRSGRWICFRCDARGDAIGFIQQIEGVSFRDAAARLGAGSVGAASLRTTPAPHRSAAVRRARLRPIDTEVLAAALELYANRLMADQQALDYLASRGFERELVERERVGFAAGGELVPYLAWRGLSAQRARRAGLLDADDREVLQGRIVFAEVRQGRPVWFIGRVLEPLPEGPRYLGLAGSKPLLGWDWASQDLRGAVLVEGPTDWLALRMWGVPGLALCGTSVSASVLQDLGRWDRLYIVTDMDAAGRDANARLVEAFGARAVPGSLPDGVKDPADLARTPDGDRLFAEAICGASSRISELATQVTADPTAGARAADHEAVRKSRTAI